MSQENVEAFQRGTAALNRGDIDAVLIEVDPAVEWHMAMQEVLGGGAAVYRGHEGIREYMRDMDEAFADVELDYTEVRDLGDRVLATGVLRARGRSSGAVIESPVGALVEANDDNKAIKVLTYLNHEEALEAAGLEK
jgi:ketosteroid isomerase-like protein